MRPWRVCGFALVWGICFQFLFPTGVFWLFISGSVIGYCIIGKSGCSCLSLVPKETKTNLMDCFCLCSEVEMHKMMRSVEGFKHIFSRERTCVLLRHYFGWTKQRCGCTYKKSKAKLKKMNTNKYFAIKKNMYVYTRYLQGVK